MSNYQTKRIIDFYLGKAPDSAGRMIDEVWTYDFDELEWHHDFIQWLFPLEKPSRFNRDAPTLTTQAISEFMSNEDLKSRITRSLDLLLDFYGFAREGDQINIAPNFNARANEWAWPDDHNHDRLSRILQSLSLLGLKKESHSLREILIQSAEDLGPRRIPFKTLKHWKSL